MPLGRLARSASTERPGLNDWILGSYTLEIVPPVVMIQTFEALLPTDTLDTPLVVHEHRFIDIVMRRLIGFVRN
jgi:hypothetical protein